MWRRSMFNRLILIYKRSTFGIRRKIFLVFVTGGVILQVMLGVNIMLVAFKYLQNDNANYVRSLTKQLNNSIDVYYDEMKNIVINISNDKNLRRMMDENYSNEYDKYRSTIELGEYLWTTSFVRKYTDVFLYTVQQDRLKAVLIQ